MIDGKSENKFSDFLSSVQILTETLTRRILIVKLEFILVERYLRNIKMQNKISYKLWIDDQWNDTTMPFRHPPSDYIPAESSREAIRLVEEKGMPSFISFDHDLGGEDTSIAFIDWLIKNRYNEEVPDFSVHSKNPIGRLNIISKMNSWKKSQGL